MDLLKKRIKDKKTLYVELKKKKLDETKNIRGNYMVKAINYSQEECRKVLINIFIIYELHFRFVERDGFRKFCMVM